MKYNLSSGSAFILNIDRDLANWLTCKTLLLYIVILVCLDDLRALNLNDYLLLYTNALELAQLHKKKKRKHMDSNFINSTALDYINTIEY